MRETGKPSKVEYWGVLIGRLLVILIAVLPWLFDELILLFKIVAVVLAAAAQWVLHHWEFRNARKKHNRCALCYYLQDALVDSNDGFDPHCSLGARLNVMKIERPWWNPLVEPYAAMIAYSPLLRSAPDETIRIRKGQYLVGLLWEEDGRWTADAFGGTSSNQVKETYGLDEAEYEQVKHVQCIIVWTLFEGVADKRRPIGFLCLDALDPAAEGAWFDTVPDGPKANIHGRLKRMAEDIPELFTPL